MRSRFRFSLNRALFYVAVAGAIFDVARLWILGNEPDGFSKLIGVLLFYSICARVIVKSFDRPTLRDGATS